MTHRFSQGAFRPAEHEVDCFDLRVEGRLPRDLSGSYLRTGPNPRAQVDADTHHWFAGNGMLHLLRLNRGQAEAYKSRFVSLESSQSGHDTGRGATVGLRRLRNPHAFGTGNSALLSYGGSTVALEDLTRPVGLDASLRAHESPAFARDLPGAMVPHPKIEPGSGCLHVLTTQLERPYLWYHIVSPDGETLHSTPIPEAGPSFYHDFCITETRLVIFDLPVTLSMEAALSDHGFPFRWDSGYEARVGVLALGGDGRDIAWVPVDPCFIMHAVNAWDDGERIVVDVIRHASMFALELYGPADNAPTLERWTLDPTRAFATVETLTDDPIEFPMIDSRWVGRRHRYTCAVEYDPANPSIFGNRIVCLDDHRSRCAEFRFDADQVIGECVFVPRPGSAAEGGGWLMGLVHGETPAVRSSCGGSEFVVFDALRLAEGPVARVRLPTRVPLGQHGCWVERL